MDILKTVTNKKYVFITCRGCIPLNTTRSLNAVFLDDAQANKEKRLKT